MEYLKKLIKAMKDIIIVMVIQYLLIFGIGILYMIFNGDDLMSFYVNDGYIILTFIYAILVIVLLNRYRDKERTLLLKDYYGSILFGISLACFLNMIIFKFEQGNEVIEVNKILLFLSSGILGPIMEELLFRKKLLTELLKFNNKYLSILLSSLIFAFLHNGVVTMIYAFILGIVFGIFYIKYNNVKITILMHMAANIVVIYLTKYNSLILILSVVGLLISYLIMDKKVAKNTLL